jgi:hypothetical protein
VSERKKDNQNRDRDQAVKAAFAHQQERVAHDEDLPKEKQETNDNNRDLLCQKAPNERPVEAIQRKHCHRISDCTAQRGLG